MTKKYIAFLSAFLIILCSALSGCELELQWGYATEVSAEEKEARDLFVAAAIQWLGRNSADGSHKEIIDIYNAHEPLAVNYAVQYTDKWCATFVSAVSIQCKYTDIIPTECGCQRQIDLFIALDRWEEADDYVPLPGDIIFYDWDQTSPGEATGWADHVGIVVGTKWPFLKVIEGNYQDAVGYHYLLLNDIQIRGFARPDYAGFLQEKTP